ncbi:hypothetical protein Cni_G09229 [Canna indica]|uniref:Reverse transcriptase domain-containing protein n=1 Tax=Canna indica TaxID=4628 RepID=A0AAQ3Q6B3_9LILI|nr:hypothetical protein Cni_G09229 [Canna indica]
MLVKDDVGDNGDPGPSGKKPSDPSFTTQVWIPIPKKPPDLKSSSSAGGSSQDGQISPRGGKEAAAKKNGDSLDGRKGIKIPSSGPVKSSLKDQLQRQSKDSTSDATRPKSNSLGSWAALFKEAISYSSRDNSKPAESIIKTIQEDSSDEVTIEDDLLELARMNWVNCLYVEYLHKDINFKIASTIGQTIKGLRAKYAKICILWKLNRSVLNGLWISSKGNREQKKKECWGQERKHIKRATAAKEQELKVMDTDKSVNSAQFKTDDSEQHMGSRIGAFNSQSNKQRDFNCVDREEDKNGDNPFKWGQSLRDFKDLHSTAGLVDIRFSGNHFTWCNNRKGMRGIHARLDKALVNWNWINLYGFNSVKHLSRIALDHRPILFVVENKRITRTLKKNFVFEHYLLENDEIENVIKETWPHDRTSSMSMEGLSLNLSKLGEKVSNWAKRNISPLEKELKTAKEELETLERLDEMNKCDDQDFNKMKCLSNKIMALNRQVHQWWSKARTKWMEKNDKNMKFFHNLAKFKKCRNAIFGIRVNDTYKEDSADIVMEFANWYKKLWSRETSNDHTHEWTMDFTEAEIWGAVNSLGRGKAPGPDGFNAEFYIRYCSILKDSIFKAFREFANSAVIPSSWGLTNLVFVPKKEGPSIITDYKPIALCNALYKILSKVSWKAVDKITSFMKFPATVKSWMQACLSSAKFKYCINGEKSEEFCSSKGVRQGDPLSPYIFIIMQDLLSRILEKQVELGAIKCFRHKGVKISHLSFADDILTRLPTSSYSSKFGKITPRYCYVCGEGVDDSKHILLECSYAKIMSFSVSRYNVGYYSGGFCPNDFVFLEGTSNNIDHAHEEYIPTHNATHNAGMRSTASGPLLSAPSSLLWVESDFI